MTVLFKKLFATTLVITLLASCTNNTQSSLPDPAAEELPATVPANSNQETIATNSEEKVPIDSIEPTDKAPIDPIAPTEKPAPTNTHQPTTSDETEPESLPTISAPSMSDTQPAENEAESQQTSQNVEQQPIVPLTSSNNYCEEFDTHLYCISSDLPAPTGPLPWGTISSFSPEVFCASDLSTDICGWITSALLTAAMEWGNYGPLEYWVLGIDADAATALTEVQCKRRDNRGQWNMNDCMRRHSPQGMHGFDYYRKVGADAIAAGQPSGSAGLNGDRQMGIHFFTSSIPVGFTDYFQVPGAEEQKTVFHEYFHAVQHSYIFTEDHRKRDELLGPVWFNEGGAEYMAQIASREARASGDLEDINSTGRWPFEFTQSMENYMNNGLANITNTCPGTALKDLTYENSCNNASYDLGAWAHAYLAYKFGADVLLETFYPNLEELGWDGSFTTSYGVTLDEFYTEFDEFLDLPISDQLAILP